MEQTNKGFSFLKLIKDHVEAGITHIPGHLLNRNAFFTYWKEITADNKWVPSHIFLLYDLILDRDPKKNSFTPITNKNKLNNGQNSWDGLMFAQHMVKYNSLHHPTPMEQKLIELSHVDVSTLMQRVDAITGKYPNITVAACNQVYTG